MPLEPDIIDRVDLYGEDFFAWTCDQAAALRARRSGENALDYDNLAEEIEDLGKAASRTCRSLVERIVDHLLKLRFSTSPDTIPHWRGEIIEFRDQLDQELTRSIENKLAPELPVIYAKRVKVLGVKGVLGSSAVEQARQEGPPDWSEIRTEDWFPESAHSEV